MFCFWKEKWEEQKFWSNRASVWSHILKCMIGIEQDIVIAMTPFFSWDNDNGDSWVRTMSVFNILATPVFLFIFLTAGSCCSVTVACVPGCGSSRSEAADFRERHVESCSWRLPAGWNLHPLQGSEDKTGNHHRSETWVKRQVPSVFVFFSSCTQISYLSTEFSLYALHLQR